MSSGKSIFPPSVKPGIPDVGAFPESWRRVPFGELLEPAMRPVRLEPNREYQLVVARRNRNGIAPRERLLGIQIKTQGQFELREGDFVIAKRQIIHGACGFVPAELDGAIVSGEYDVFRVRDALHAPFLRWFTHSVYFQQTTYQSSIGVALEKMIFRTERWLRWLMPLPTKGQQVRVANVFDSVSSVEESLEAAIEGRRRLKRALLHEFAASPHGGGASSRVLHLGDVVSIRSGNTPSKSRPDYWDGEFPWVSGKDLKTPRLVDSIDRITDLAVEESATVVSEGTLVILVRGMTLLKDVPVAVAMRPLAINQDVKGLEPKSEVDSGYLLCALLAKRSKLMGFVNRAGHGTGKLDTDCLLSLPLRVPPLADQRRVAAAFDSIDTEIALLDRQLAAYRTLKRGLMQKLLTGAIDIPDDADDPGTAIASSA